MWYNIVYVLSIGTLEDWRRQATTPQDTRNKQRRNQHAGNTRRRWAAQDPKRSVGPQGHGGHSHSHRRRPDHPDGVSQRRAGPHTGRKGLVEAMEKFSASSGGKPG